jgi:hypothetical protein
MTRLADVYEGDVGRLQSRRRVQLGVALLGVGTVLALVSIFVATTDIVIGDQYGAWRVAGLLGGLGTSAILGGVVTVLPASPRLRVVAWIGASISLLGVAMFWHAYPAHWAGHGDQLTPYVTSVYFLGTLTLVCCLFAGIVTLKRRNDPGGTVSMEFITRETTEREVVTVDRPMGSGGVGMLGGQPEGNVETQTNRPDDDETRSERSSRQSSRSGSPASDGGRVQVGLGSNTTAPGTGTDHPAHPPRETDRTTDRYCGNCQHFEYVQTEDDIQPHCGYYSDVMEDMNACDEWTPNR